MDDPLNYEGKPTVLKILGNLWPFGSSKVVVGNLDLLVDGLKREEFDKELLFILIAKSNRIPEKEKHDIYKSAFGKEAWRHINNHINKPGFPQEYKNTPNSLFISIRDECFTEIQIRTTREWRDKLEKKKSPRPDGRNRYSLKRWMAFVARRYCTMLAFRGNEN